MMEIVENWAALVGMFLLTGGLYQATKRTIGAKAGDPGFKGFFYVWGRWLLMPLGAGLGALGHLFGVPLHEAFGDEVGGAMTAGVISSGAASFAYEQVIGLAKARLRHKAAQK